MMQLSRMLALSLLAMSVGSAAFGDDIRPEARALADARPMADEKCIERCDTESDRCMQDAERDAGKLQACDDKYSECLQACEGG